jgi:hypothetical protein
MTLDLPNHFELPAQLPANDLSETGVAKLAENISRTANRPLNRSS